MRAWQRFHNAAWACAILLNGNDDDAVQGGFNIDGRLNVSLPCSQSKARQPCAEY
jgi:hypothetical protein